MQKSTRYPNRLDFRSATGVWGRNCERVADLGIRRSSRSLGSGVALVILDLLDPISQLRRLRNRRLGA